ncbi:hypothetical protein BH20ACT9_BH20ACT9_20970 [soil metagenome]
MKMIQIRNVPDDVHRRLKARAAHAGLSLSDFLLREATQMADRLSWEEVAERARERGAVTLSQPPERLVRAERDRQG